VKTKQTQIQKKRYEDILIGIMNSGLKLSKLVMEDAMDILKIVKDNKWGVGRSAESTTAAAIYISARNNREPLWIEELQEIVGMEKRNIISSYKHLIKKGIKSGKPFEPEDFVPKILTKIEEELKRDYNEGFSTLYKQYKKKIAQIWTKTEEMIELLRNKGMLDGKSRKVVVATMIYMVTIMYGVKVPQRVISKVTYCTEVSIRNTLKDTELKTEYEKIFNEGEDA